MPNCLFARIYRQAYCGRVHVSSLGFRAQKIEQIIREEMNSVADRRYSCRISSKELWEKTGRWNTMDDLYKVSDSSGHEVASVQHEEVVTPLWVHSFSYRDLPICLSVQNKFEWNFGKSDTSWCEFIMKDFILFIATSKILQNIMVR